MDPIDLSRVRRLYRDGINVVDYLKRQLGSHVNTEQVIEIAYDMQAGSYVEYFRKHFATETVYHRELAEVLGRYLAPGDSVLDVGTGEMTTLASIAAACYERVAVAYAMDISVSRLIVGRRHLAATLAADLTQRIRPVSATLFELPFADSSIDVVWTSHAIEPNGGREQQALTELVRVARRYLVLFEPSYRRNSEAGRQRMQQLGYVGDLEDLAARLPGVQLEAVVPIQHTQNPLNPTYAHVLRKSESASDEQPTLRCPLTHGPLRASDGYLYSSSALLAYPILEGIPILRRDKGISASILDTEG